MCRVTSARLCTLFLFNDLVLLGKESLSGLREAWRKDLRLHRVGARHLSRDRTCIQLVWAGRALTLQLESAEQSRKWIDEFNKAMRLMQAAGAYSGAKHARDWVPDHAAAACTICNSMFTIINRKHHCRCWYDICL